MQTFDGTAQTYEYKQRLIELSVAPGGDSVRARVFERSSDVPVCTHSGLTARCAARSAQAEVDVWDSGDVSYDAFRKAEERWELPRLRARAYERRHVPLLERDDYEETWPWDEQADDQQYEDWLVRMHEDGMQAWEDHLDAEVEAAMGDAR